VKLLAEQSQLHTDIDAVRQACEPYQRKLDDFLTGTCSRTRWHSLSKQSLEMFNLIRTAPEEIAHCVHVLTQLESYIDELVGCYTRNQVTEVKLSTEMRLRSSEEE
jgi:hypothetical protein